MNAAQARKLIWNAITKAGGALAVSDKTRPKPRSRAAVSVSMLYKYSQGRAVLGVQTVNALRPILRNVKPAVWLVAMGVEKKIDGGF
jgi:hypothetical protein